MKTVKGYKLFRVKKDGTLTSLFINKSVALPLGKWMKAEEHPTDGYAFRPGWHATKQPVAPHLSEKGRAWCKVSMRSVKTFKRPESQGGEWLLAKYLRIDKVLTKA